MMRNLMVLLVVGALADKAEQADKPQAEAVEAAEQGELSAGPGENSSWNFVYCNCGLSCVKQVDNWYIFNLGQACACNACPETNSTEAKLRGAKAVPSSPSSPPVPSAQSKMASLEAVPSTKSAPTGSKAKTWDGATMPGSNLLFGHELCKESGCAYLAGGLSFVKLTLDGTLARERGSVGEACERSAQLLRHIAAQVTGKELAELRSFRNPPAVVCQVLEAVAVILGLADTRWSSVRKLLDSNLLSRLSTYFNKAAVDDIVAAGGAVNIVQAASKESLTVLTMAEEVFSKACLRKATFVKVGTLHPDAHGVNLLLKVVGELKPVERSAGRFFEVTCGDETAQVILSLQEHQKDAIQLGKVIAARNASVRMVQGFMRLVVDKWGKLDADVSGSIGEIGSTNLSQIEYELVAP
ncbi:unnamed protein product [Effrenium voratum]|uniref:Single-stranded DNA binding protein Ssb-like OB fold domain-containing protein n=1 Tax=Effrenium voratum TaxID=2562239 RepID=A0AA36II29_9DINO|nr:unnamed protein product [Effrenium voratum]